MSGYDGNDQDEATSKLYEQGITSAGFQRYLENKFPDKNTRSQMLTYLKQHIADVTRMNSMPEYSESLKNTANLLNGVKVGGKRRVKKSIKRRRCKTSRRSRRSKK